MPPLVAQVLVPLSTHSRVASSKRARVRMAPTSDPASGSEEQNAPSFGSSAVPNISGSHWPSCSGVPLPARAAAARPVPRIDSAMPASPQNSSSNTVSMPMPVGSAACWANSSGE